MHTQPTETQGTDDRLTLALAGVTKTRCPACGREEHWTVLADRYACPQCAADMVVVAATGHTLDDVLGRMAQDLTEAAAGPYQPTLPGCRPAFNFQSAYESIVERRVELRTAEASAEALADRYKAAKKRVDTIRGELDQLIDDYEERSRDVRYETATEDAPAADAPADVHDDADAVPILPAEGQGDDVAPVPNGDAVNADGPEGARA